MSKQLAETGNPPSAARHVWVGEDEGQTALLVDGVVQSVVVDDGPLGPGYWPLMLPEFAPRRALILGLGGGTVAHLLVRRFGAIEIVGVEHDADIIRLARSAFGLDKIHVTLVEGDAFDVVTTLEGPFDYVAVDLYDGDIPARIFTRPFLNAVKRLVSPGGAVFINFFRDRRTKSRLQRLTRVFPRVSSADSRDNVVATCRPR